LGINEDHKETAMTSSSQSSERIFDIAIVGTGGIARVHAENIKRLKGRARIIAAVDVDADRLRAFASEWGVQNTYSSVEELLKNHKPDLVHLCTPPGLHREQALACLRAGVNALTEKPPALSLAEIDEIIEAEKVSGASFATVFQHRFGDAAINLRRQLQAGSFGQSMTAVCNTLWYRPDAYFAVPWRGKWEIEGGGPTMGHGIHQFDLLLSILGEWEEVVAVAARRARPTATEDLSAAIVTFADGTVATVTNSLLSPRETSYLRFDFDHATVEVEHLYGYSDASWKVTAAPGFEEEVAAAWADGPHGHPSGHAAQFSSMLDALEQGTPLPVTSAASRSTLEFIAAVYASAFEGRRIRRGEIGPDSPFYRSMEGTGAPWAAAEVSA
jgi:predicted dehydrogenase